MKDKQLNILYLRLAIECIDMLSEHNLEVLARRLEVNHKDFLSFIQEVKQYLDKNQDPNLISELHYGSFGSKSLEEMRKSILEEAEEAIQEIDIELEKSKAVEEERKKVEAKHKPLQEAIRITKTPLFPMMPILLIFDALSVIFPRPILKAKVIA